MNLFVSYTRRDGIVTRQLLVRLHAHLTAMCNPFVHAVEADHLSHQQFGVLRALLRSHAVLLVESPAVRQSPWVRLELAIARLMMLPVLTLDARELVAAAHRSGSDRARSTQ
jgi:hypothetical protein